LKRKLKNDEPLKNNAQNIATTRRMPMWIKKGIIVCTALFGLTVGVSSIAQSKSNATPNLPNMVQNLQKKCKSDLDKYCKNVNPGEGRIAACLDSKEDQLSPECKATWTGTKAQVSKRIDKAEIAFRKSCNNDLQKFCSNTASGRGRLLDCLNNHRSDLTSSCQKFYSTLEQKLSELVG
jgi:hypothetical protein